MKLEELQKIKIAQQQQNPQGLLKRKMQQRRKVFDNVYLENNTNKQQDFEF